MADAVTKLVLATGDLLNSTSLSSVVPYTRAPLLGLNLSGLENDAPNVVPVPKSQVTYFWSKGFRLLREGFDWVQLQPTLQGDFDPAYLAQLDAQVLDATSTGFRLVIDAHNYGHRNGKFVGSSDVPIAAFADLWKRLAKRYRNNPLVVFGLMNEPDPNHIDFQTWLSACNAAIAAIRGVDFASPHVISAPFLGSSCPVNPLSRAEAFLAGIVDPAGLTVFEFHQYFDYDMSGRANTVLSQTMALEILTHISALAERRGKLLYVGEWGVGNNEDGLALLRNFLGLIQQRSRAFYAVSWWGGGDFNSVLAPNPYPFGIVPGPDGSDTPFVIEHQKFMPGGSLYNAAQQVSGYDALLSNGVTFTAGAGKFGGAALRPGPTSYAMLGSTNPQNSTAFWANQFTLSGWFNMPAANTDYVSLFSSNSFNFDMPPGGVLGGVTIAGNGYHHIALSRGPSGASVFVDGALVSHDPNAVPGEPASGTVYVGSTIGNATGFFPGFISNVELLCVETLDVLPNTAALTGNEPNSIGCWPFNGNGNAVRISPAGVLNTRTI